MEYKVIIKGFDSGLNELLSGFTYDWKKKRVYNPIKKKNDEVCIKAIRNCAELRRVKITKPIFLHYYFYCKDKRRDKMNIFSACDKSFEDALQKCGVIANDGWQEIYQVSHEFYVDKNNPRVVVLIEEMER